MPSEVTINAASVQATVYDANTQELNEALRPDELAVIRAADKLLKADPQLKASDPRAVLERIESYRGVGDTEHGRYYLRY